MGADADTDVERSLQRELDGRAGEAQRFARGRGQVNIDEISALHDAQATGRREVGLDLAGDRALGIAELQRGEAFAMQGYIGVGRIGVEALANHEQGFAMRIAALFRKGNVGGQCDVAGGLLPCELEGVGRGPQVFTTAGDGVGVMRGIVLRGAGMQHRANVRVILKDAEGGRGGLRAKQADHEKKRQNDATQEGYISEDDFLHDEKASTTFNGKIGGWKRIVNRGAGAAMLRLRLASSPEFQLATLTSAGPWFSISSISMT